MMTVLKLPANEKIEIINAQIATADRRFAAPADVIVGLKNN